MYDLLDDLSTTLTLPRDIVLNSICQVRKLHQPIDLDEKCIIQNPRCSRSKVTYSLCRMATMPDVRGI